MRRRTLSLTEGQEATIGLQPRGFGLIRFETEKVAVALSQLMFLIELGQIDEFFPPQIVNGEIESAVQVELAEVRRSGFFRYRRRFRLIGQRFITAANARETDHD